MHIPSQPQKLQIMHLVGHPTQAVFLTDTDHLLGHRDETAGIDMTLFPDFVKYETFSLGNCGSRTSQVQSALEWAILAMTKALVDSINGPKNPHGFTTFFKTEDNALYVEELLDQMRNGDPVIAPARSYSPRILCSSDEAQYASCYDPDEPIALYSNFLDAVVLCPHFFRLPLRPIRSNCPTVSKRTNRLRGSASSFVLYQSYSIVHELVHF